MVRATDIWNIKNRITDQDEVWTEYHRCIHSLHSMPTHLPIKDQGIYKRQYQKDPRGYNERDNFTSRLLYINQRSDQENSAEDRRNHRGKSHDAKSRDKSNLGARKRQTKSKMEQGIRFVTQKYIQFCYQVFV